MIQRTRLASPLRLQFLGTAFVLAVSLPACFVDRGGTGTPADLTASANPALVCPGDPVELTWAYTPVGSRGECSLSASAGECPIASAVDISPEGVLRGPSPHDNRGSEVVRPDRDLALTLDGYQVIRAGGARIEPVAGSVAVDVIEPPEDRGGHAVGVCGDAGPTWTPITISGEDEWGETLVASEVCTLAASFYEFLTVRIAWSDGSTEEFVDVPRGECRTVTPRPARIMEAITTTGRPLNEDVTCPGRGVTRGFDERTPENINLGLQLTCNMRG